MADYRLKSVLQDSLSAVQQVREKLEKELPTRAVGRLEYLGEGIAHLSGLEKAETNELLTFEGNRMGMVFNLEPNHVGAVFLDKHHEIHVGSEVQRTHRVMDVPVGEELLGRTIDAIGRPLDSGDQIRTGQKRPIEQEAPGMMDRAPVNVPLQTGLKVVDALVPIGRGQRELILGDRQTGKTAVAVDTIINQRDSEVICIYCAIGQKSSDVARTIARLEEHQSLNHTIVLVASGEDPPGLVYITPYAATSIGEFFRDQGRDVLIVYDDLSKHARAYRELSLLLRRPPAREAYPGDIFYIHSRLLERSTHLIDEEGGGSLTALPVVETQAQNISAYIPTNLISITDGQVYLSPDLYQKGIMPAIDVGKSVSRVGGKTQLPAYRKVAGDLRLSYSQFEELEVFSRFSTRLDEETKKKLQRGKRIRELFKQPQYQPLTAAEQVAVLYAAANGLFDRMDPERQHQAEQEIYQMMHDELKQLSDKILSAESLSDEEEKELVDKISDKIVPAAENDETIDGDENADT
ncbi:alternate F1F0 ATPase, F1 subunit alpha [candidate division KSB1 bacterium]|nr:alternate F1F0 ATPase, F1 subunit alpha [candidate division KSB1 bacterium]